MTQMGRIMAGSAVVMIPEPQRLSGVLRTMAESLELNGDQDVPAGRSEVLVIIKPLVEAQAQQAAPNG